MRIGHQIRAQPCVASERTTPFCNLLERRNPLFSEGKSGGYFKPGRVDCKPILENFRDGNAIAALKDRLAARSAANFFLSVDV
jgi:hypothetical protein